MHSPAAYSSGLIFFFAIVQCPIIKGGCSLCHVRNSFVPLSELHRACIYISLVLYIHPLSHSTQSSNKTCSATCTAARLRISSSIAPLLHSHVSHIGLSVSYPAHWYSLHVLYIDISALLCLYCTKILYFHQMSPEDFCGYLCQLCGSLCVFCGIR